MLNNLKSLAGLMSQMGDLQAKADQMQQELSRRTVEGDAGAGAVRVTMNGKLEVKSVKLDPTILATLAGSGADADQRIVEDLIAAACNDAYEKARGLISAEMQKATGGLSVPGLEKLFGS
ncbi:MAG: YbaB/EbfC family nucleoid-associated protein [Phycisphaeraceae bacterium]|nr:YbaB/EbfC family nucleoid-associated protein [Phycisphaeraceae bacterium]